MTKLRSQSSILSKKMKEYESKLMEAWDISIEDFATINRDFALGSYNYVLKKALAFLMAKLPDERPNDLQPVLEVTDGLKLSTFKEIVIENEVKVGDKDDLVDRPSNLHV